MIFYYCVGIKMTQSRMDSLGYTFLHFCSLLILKDMKMEGFFIGSFKSSGLQALQFLSGDK
jgi:hypothetical protein